MNNQSKGIDQWILWDVERENAHYFDRRGDAEEKMDNAEEMGVEVELYPPGEAPEELFETTDAFDVAGEAQEREADGGEPEQVQPEIVEGHPGPDVSHDEEYELEDRKVGEDPLDWMPQDFYDPIDGTQAINRKGFEVLSHFYNIDVASEVVVAPEETDYEYCRVQATATTEDGRECEAHGSAHVDRGDDHYLLLEMADTRARKRALSIATGVGAVAVEELRNEPIQ